MSARTLREELLHRACSVGDPTEPEHDHTACQDSTEAVVAAHLLRVLTTSERHSRGETPESGSTAAVDVLVAHHGIVTALLRDRRRAVMPFANRIGRAMDARQRLAEVQEMTPAEAAHIDLLHRTGGDWS